MGKQSIGLLREKKERKEKIAVLTAYDALFAYLAVDAGVELLLVGDSLGMVLQGSDSTLPVLVDDMVYHVSCVAAGNRRAAQAVPIMADMPFMSYGTLEQGLANAKLLMQAGAHIVKLEGGDWLISLIESLGRQGVPVCAHLGLTPQSVHKLGGYVVQGRTQAEGDVIARHAQALDEAGVDMILLECVPALLAKQITEAVSVPVIGIGAGADTDGQVLVMHDMLGLHFGTPAKFVKNFLKEGRNVQQAFAAYVEEVKAGIFPSADHIF